MYPLAIPSGAKAMAPSTLLILACCLPPAVKATVDRIRAERAADPEHWQTTPIPPIPIGGTGVPYWLQPKRMSPDELERLRQIEREARESEKRPPVPKDPATRAEELRRELRDLEKRLQEAEKKRRELEAERDRLRKKR